MFFMKNRLSQKNLPDSLLPLQRLMETWATGARDAEIERVIQTLEDELWRRERDIRCEGKAEAYAGIAGQYAKDDSRVES